MIREDISIKISSQLNDFFLKCVSEKRDPLDINEVGVVTYVAKEYAILNGLRGVLADEIVELGSSRQAIVYNLDPNEVGVLLLNNEGDLDAGMEARRTFQTFAVPVGPGLLGRVLNALGEPLDELGAIAYVKREFVERESPNILDRSAVREPLQTGYKIIDSIVPIGKGQRQLILGDRQTGKTSLALDTIINQKGKNVICVYCSIGQRGTSVAKVIAELEHHNALEYTVVIVAGGEETAALQYITPFAATTIAEYFMYLGKDALIVYDDLTKHAQSYRELSLLMKRPPGREAFPGDIFFLHSRLLERSTRLAKHLGGGSLTALPIVETEAQNFSAYIPTNIVSITDGQIYLNSELYQKGIFPAIDIGKSVSRVGGKTQLKPFLEVSGNLRLSISQFEELEIFSKFGTKIDEATAKILERGKRIREVLKQGRFDQRSVTQQIAVLLAVTEGLFDEVPLNLIKDIDSEIARIMKEEMIELSTLLDSGETLNATNKQMLVETIKKIALKYGGTAIA